MSEKTEAALKIFYWRQLLECGSPLPLSLDVDEDMQLNMNAHRSQSGRGLPHSKS